MHAIVKGSKLDNEGKSIGNMNNNPLLDTREYEVQFADITTEFITANIISDNLLAQVYEERNHHILLHNIIDNRHDVNDKLKEDTFTKTPNEMK